MLEFVKTYLKYFSAFFISMVDIKNRI